MKKNIGKTDRVIRMLLALIIGVLLLTGVLKGSSAIILGIAAAALVFTVITRFCSLYVPFGISTLNEKEERSDQIQR